MRTGDLGWVDDHGRLRLVGRSKEMYVRGGYNVYPVEVEGVLSSHPGVAAVAIVPRADPVMGEIGVAVVVPRAKEHLKSRCASTLAELREHAGSALAAYKLPQELQLRDALPPLTARRRRPRPHLRSVETQQGPQYFGSFAALFDRASV